VDAAGRLRGGQRGGERESVSAGAPAQYLGNPKNLATPKKYLVTGLSHKKPLLKESAHKTFAIAKKNC